MNAAEAIAAAAMRCMETELAAKKQCMSELEAVPAETPGEYKLKGQTLDGLRTSIGKLEAHLQVSRILIDALHHSAQREKGMDQ